MMTMAWSIGIAKPDLQLINLDLVAGLPRDRRNPRLKDNASSVRARSNSRVLKRRLVPFVNQNAARGASPYS